jgi:hypothetical protein
MLARRHECEIRRCPAGKIHPADLHNVERGNGAKFLLLNSVRYVFPFTADSLRSLDKSKLPAARIEFKNWQKSFIPTFFRVPFRLLLLPATRFPIQPPAAQLFAYQPAVTGDRLNDQIEAFDEAERLPQRDRLARASKMRDDGFEEAAYVRANAAA